MAEKLTPQQAQAVTSRGGKLLVSAAAGSGKTKVLVDRLLRFVMDPKDPANVDDFLIITYTKAAAAELRGKIAAKLSEKIAEYPENKHLQRQMQRLYLAKISTVHSFCADILREYAYALDLSADFRVADENECVQLREAVMEKLLDNAYNDPSEQVRTFFDTQGLGRSDALVPEIVWKVFDSANCHLDPQKFLEDSIHFATAQNISDASQTLWGAYLVQDLHTYLDLQSAAMSACADQAAKVSGWEKASAVLRDTVVQMRHLRDAKTWDEIFVRRNIDYGRLVFSKKGGNAELAEKIKAVRDDCKKNLTKKLGSFCETNQQVLRDLESTLPSLQGLVCLVADYAKAYAQAKRSRRLVDFADLEHKMLDLLLGKRRSGPTAIARELGLRYREIMVDEYQDSNAVQDAIFGALTQQRQNLFMVGDVKQSIYQFRLADPTIFLEKYETFVPEEQAQPGQPRKVLLSSNFRSAGSVIDAVNDVFGCCMTQAVGDIDYTEAEALREGIPHIKVDEQEVELHTIDVQEDTYEEEAAFVADRIHTLLHSKHYVREGETLRRITADDIVILLRSPGSVGMHYQRALEQRGIACDSGVGTDLLQTQEISTLRSLLQIISNPRQDIPLVATLLSPIFAFTANDLAQLRSKNRKCSIYEALCADEGQKSKAFLELLSKLRKFARMNSLSKLVQNIFLHTRMDSIFSAMPDGQARLENLRTFYQLCSEFESTAHRNLEQFLEHLAAMEKRGLAASHQASAGRVTIMSIHKSKGLEFPVVFLCGLSREFNRESLRAQVLCHKELGLGLSCVDTAKRLRYPSIAKRAIAAKTLRESLSEEMRVLYVAMTRARDRLIMTYSVKNLVKDLSGIALKMGIAPRELMTGDVVCPGEWILYAALQRTEAGELFALSGNPQLGKVSSRPWLIKASQIYIFDEETAQKTKGVDRKLPENAVSKIQSGLSFQYPHCAATQAPSKQTATQRKGRQKDDEAAENTEQRTFERKWRKASFVQRSATSKEFGTAMHAVLQHIDLHKCADVDAVKQEVQRLTDQNFITPKQGEMVDCEMIAKFFQTDLGRRVCVAREVLREFKFSILDDAVKYDGRLAGEKILLQGVADCAIIETDGITLIDFKTDYVTQETVDAVAQGYKAQVVTYADALRRIFRREVKETYLYFFRLDKAYKV